LEVSKLCAKLGFEDEKAGEVDGEPQNGHDGNRVHDFFALDGLFGVLPALEVSLAAQQILRVHLKIFADHFNCVFHLLCVFLVHVGLAVRDVKQTGEGLA
jgi:hypothetical protein